MRKTQQWMTLRVRPAAHNCFHPKYQGLCLLTISWGVTPAPVIPPHPPCVLFSPVPPPMPFLPALCHSCAAVVVAPTALVRALAGSTVILQTFKSLAAIMLPLNLPPHSCRHHSFRVLIFSLANSMAWWGWHGRDVWVETVSHCSVYPLGLLKLHAWCHVNTAHLGSDSFLGVSSCHLHIFSEEKSATAPPHHYSLLSAQLCCCTPSLPQSCI